MVLDLKSRNGDIDIPQALHVDIELRGDNVSVRGGPLNKGNISRRGVQGSLNDGGPLVRAKSNDGRIVLRLQQNPVRYLAPAGLSVEPGALSCSRGTLSRTRRAILLPRDSQ